MSLINEMKHKVIRGEEVTLEHIFFCLTGIHQSLEGLNEKLERAINPVEPCDKIPHHPVEGSPYGNRP